MSRALLALTLLLVFLVVPDARADAVIVNKAMHASAIAEAKLGDGLLQVEIEAGWSGVAPFADLLPDELSERLGNAPLPHDQRVRRFFQSGLVIEADGRALPGRLVSIEVRKKVRRDAISGEPLPPAPGEVDEEVLFLQLEYEVPGRPDALTFASVPRKPDGRESDIGFVLYHGGVAVNDFRYLVPTLTVDLDWGDPWFSRFRRPPMWRAYDAPLNVFLYAEPHEVRVEVIVRPLDLDPLIDLGLAGRDTIRPEEFATIPERVAEFLAGTFTLEIDGKPAVPVLDRVHFLRRTLKSSTVIDPPEELNVFSAQLGVIYIVPRVGLPQEARLTWSVFPGRIQRVPTAATDEAGPLPGMIDRSDPVLVWTNYLKHPADLSPRAVDTPPPTWTRWLRPAGVLGLIVGALLSAAAGASSMRRRQPAWTGFLSGALMLAASGGALLAGRAAQVNAVEARDVLGKLLFNVYRSFDFRQEAEVYDMLASSVDGPLLESTYLETRRALLLQSQGGARAKVNEVELQPVEPVSLPDRAGFRVDADWTVTGSVGHWGHIHRRLNRYRAGMTVEPVDGVWKITAMDVTSEERVQ